MCRRRMSIEDTPILYSGSYSDAISSPSCRYGTNTAEADHLCFRSEFFRCWVTQILDQHVKVDQNLVACFQLRQNAVLYQLTEIVLRDSRAGTFLFDFMYRVLNGQDDRNGNVTSVEELLCYSCVLRFVCILFRQVPKNPRTLIVR